MREEKSRRLKMQRQERKREIMRERERLSWGMGLLLFVDMKGEEAEEARRATGGYRVRVYI